MTLRIGTRTSALAREQATTVAGALEEAGHETTLVGVESDGDASRAIPIHRIGVAGAFTARLEAALSADEVDLAVHSLKDLPLESAEGLELSAILPRGTPEDALLVAPHAHAPDREPPLAEGARVATSGPRRRSQLLATREDLVPVDVRGNVDTRLAKLRAGRFDALVMAACAIDRAPLDVDDVHVHPLDPARYPPAPGQAAIAVQARRGSPAADAAARLDDPSTRSAVEAERTVLGALGGGCGLPLGAWLRREDDAWRLDATFAGHDWTPDHRARVDRAEARGPAPMDLASRAAKRFEATRARRHATDANAPPPAPDEALLVAATSRTAERWARRLRALEVPAVPVPTRTVEPADPPQTARERLLDVDWIVATSRRAAAPLAELAGETPPDAAVGTAGPSTAAALQAHGLPAHLVAPDRTGASLAGEIARLADDDARVLLAQGETARDTVRDRLREAGLDVETWTAYRTIPVEDPLAGLDPSLPASAVLVTSPRNAEVLDLPRDPPLAEDHLAIGETTADALRERGLDPLVLDRPTPDAVPDVLG